MKTPNYRNSERGNSQRPHVIRRRIYFSTAFVGQLAILSAWIVRGHLKMLTPLEGILFPVLFFCFSLLLIILVWKPRTVWLGEIIMFSVTAIALLSRFYDVLFMSDGLDEAAGLFALTDLLYWFPMVYVLAFLIFESQRKLLIGSSLFFTVSLLMALAFGLQGGYAGTQADNIYLLGRFLIANLMYIILLGTAVYINGQYIRLRTLAEVMEDMANTDALIQIANRRQLETALSVEIARVEQSGRRLSAILWDIDNFKAVNDRYGHDVGDAVLIEVAQVARTNLRAVDLFGRWGGEEFLVLAQDISRDDIHDIAERLRQQIEIYSIKPCGNLTISMGIAEYRRGETQENWLKRLDMALYRAKHEGRNRVILAE